MSRLDRWNRLVASALGLALVGAGCYGLARSTGVGGNRHDPVLTAMLRREVVDNAGVVGGALTFLALVVAWAGWRWLRAQLLPAPSLGAVHLSDGEGGHTWLDAKALAEAVTRDLQAQPGVAAGRTRVLGHPRAPAVDLHADLSADADLDDVRRQVDDVVVARLRGALERPDLPATVRYGFGTSVGRGLS